MAGSAKRYGLDTGDLDLDLRLRRIESELERRVKTNVDALFTSRARIAPPKISGIRVAGSTPGAITIAWNPTPIPDLRRYEVDFAEDLAFVTNKQTFNVASVTFQFSTLSTVDGTGGTTVFVRVRAVNSFSEKSPFSAILNTSTGQVVSGDLADGAIGTDQLADGAVGTDELAADAVGTDQIQDDAVTGVKTTGLGSELTLPGPPFSPSDADQFIVINGAATSYAGLAGALPPVTSGNANKFVAANSGASALEYVAGALPPVTAGNASKFVAANVGASALEYVAGALPPVTSGNANKFVAANVGASALAYVDIIAGSVAAGTATGEDGQNLKGKIDFPSGLRIQWDTVSTTAGATAEFALVDGYDTTHYTVFACPSGSLGSATSADSTGISAWVPTGGNKLTHVELNNDLDIDMHVTYISMGTD